jgi:hypothetical protein
MSRAGFCLWASVMTSVVLIGCRHYSELPFRQQEPRNRQDPDEIRRKIVGRWTVDQDANGPEPFVSLNLHASGDFSVVIRGNDDKWMEKPIDESKFVRKQGKWCSDSGLNLVFGISNNIPLKCDGVMLGTNCVFFPIVYVNDHELVCTPGMSMAGRIRFLKYFE